MKVAITVFLIVISGAMFGQVQNEVGAEHNLVLIELTSQFQAEMKEGEVIDLTKQELVNRYGEDLLDRYQGNFPDLPLERTELSFQYVMDRTTASQECKQLLQRFWEGASRAGNLNEFLSAVETARGSATTLRNPAEQSAMLSALDIGDHSIRLWTPAEAGGLGQIALPDDVNPSDMALHDFIGGFAGGIMGGPLGALVGGISSSAIYYIEHRY